MLLFTGSQVTRNCLLFAMYRQILYEHVHIFTWASRVFYRLSGLFARMFRIRAPESSIRIIMYTTVTNCCFFFSCCHPKASTQSVFNLFFQLRKNALRDVILTLTTFTFRMFVLLQKRTK